MRTTATLLSAAALAGLVTAKPAPQQLDFAQISAAPSVQVGPTGIALNQTVSLQTSVVVTTAATAAASATSSPSKRDLEKRTLGLIGNTINNINCLLFKQCGSQQSSSSSSSSSQAAKSTSCTSSSTIAKASATAAPIVISSSAAVVLSTSTSAAVVLSTSSSAPVVVVAATSAASSTIQTSSGTSTTSSSTECPTQIEEGTYCGFINPEDPCSPQPGGE